MKFSLCNALRLLLLVAVCFSSSAWADVAVAPREQPSVETSSIDVAPITQPERRERTKAAIVREITMLVDIGFKSAELIWRVTATNSGEPIVVYAEGDSTELRQTFSELYGDGVAIRISPRSQVQTIECRTIVDEDDVDQWECVGL